MKWKKKSTKQNTHTHEKKNEMKVTHNQKITLPNFDRTESKNTNCNRNEALKPLQKPRTIVYSECRMWQRERKVNGKKEIMWVCVCECEQIANIWKGPRISKAIFKLHTVKKNSIYTQRNINTPRELPFASTFPSAKS